MDSTTFDPRADYRLPDDPSLHKFQRGGTRTLCLSQHPAVHSLLAGPLPEHRPLGLSQNTIMPGSSLCSTRTPWLTLYGHAAFRSGRVKWMLEEELGLPAVPFDHLWRGATHCMMRTLAAGGTVVARRL